jgi:hypothetical protein
MLWPRLINNLCVHEAKLKKKNCLRHLQLLVKLNDVHVKCTNFRKVVIFFWTMNRIGFLINRLELYYKQYYVHFGCANEQNDQYKKICYPLEHFQKKFSLSLVTHSWNICSTLVCHFASWAWFMKVNWVLVLDTWYVHAICLHYLKWECW